MFKINRHYWKHLYVNKIYKDISNVCLAFRASLGSGSMWQQSCILTSHVYHSHKNISSISKLITSEAIDGSASQELFFLGTQVCFSAPTWQLTDVSKSSSRGSISLLRPLYPHVYHTYIHTFRDRDVMKNEKAWDWCAGEKLSKKASGNVLGLDAESWKGLWGAG